MVKRLLYYVADGTNPYENLAVETQLLNMVDEETLILYLWQNENTVVIGKNQNPWAECNCFLLEQEGGRVARRSSGGGAVYHDIGNLNFTFLSSAQNYDVARNMKIIQKSCEYEGIITEISGRNDITADGKKFSGNAFYNSKEKCYHHGTILVCANKEKMQKFLTPSKAKLESKGVKSVSSRVVNLAEIAPEITCESMKNNLVKACEEILSLTAETIDNIDAQSVKKLSEKYGSWDYIFGKTIDFSVSVEERFGFGQVCILLRVSDGIIKEVQTFTDAMDFTLAEKINAALTDCKYETFAIHNRLENAMLPKEIRSLFE